MIVGAREEVPGDLIAAHVWHERLGRREWASLSSAKVNSQGDVHATGRDYYQGLTIKLSGNQGSTKKINET